MGTGEVSEDSDIFGVNSEGRDDGSDLAFRTGLILRRYYAVFHGAATPEVNHSCCSRTKHKDSRACLCL